MIYFAVSLYLGVVCNVKCLNAMSSSSDGNFLVYEKDEKVYLKNYHNDTTNFISEGKMPTISSDGRFIVLSKTNENKKCLSIINGQEEDCVDIYLYDRLKEKFFNKTKEFDNHSYVGKISSDNRFLVIETLSSNIEGLSSSCKSYYSSSTRTCSNIISIDLESNKMEIITNNSHYDSFDPSVNENGSVITFRSFSPFTKDIKKVCYNQYYDSSFYCSTIYYYKDGNIKRVSSGKYDAYNPLVSLNGKYITYQSFDVEVDNYYHYYNSIYKYDIDKEVKTLITNNPNRMVENVYLSDDGNLSGFISEATNLTSLLSFSPRYFLYNEKNQDYTVLAEECEKAISTDNGKEYFYLSNNEVFKGSYTDIKVSTLKDTYFLLNSSYNLTKDLQVPKDCNFKIVDVGNFSINQIGDYPITIEVYNQNESVTYSYIAHVIEKDDPPVFECLSYYKVEVGDVSFSLANKVKVNDLIDGNLLYQVVNNGDFDIYKKGSYQIVLKATDSGQNTTFQNITIEVYEKKKSSFLSFIGAIFFFGGLLYIYFSCKKSRCS